MQEVLVKQANEQAERLKSMEQKLFAAESDIQTFISRMVMEYQAFARAQDDKRKADEQAAVKSDCRKHEDLQSQLKSVIDMVKELKAQQNQLQRSTRETVV